MSDITLEKLTLWQQKHRSKLKTIWRTSKSWQWRTWNQWTEKWPPLWWTHCGRYNRNLDWMSLWKGCQLCVLCVWLCVVPPHMQTWWLTAWWPQVSWRRLFERRWRRPCWGVTTIRTKRSSATEFRLFDPLQTSARNTLNPISWTAMVRPWCCCNFYLKLDNYFFFSLISHHHFKFPYLTVPNPVGSGFGVVIVSLQLSAMSAQTP